MTTIGANWQAIRQRIDTAAEGRFVALVAVSKGHDAAAVRAAYQAGQRAFGENYAQEAVAKMTQLKDLALEWHFIGPLQSNKTQLIAEQFDWVHTVERDKIAQRLSNARPEAKGALNVCLQVNSGAEASKHGVATTSVRALAHYVSNLPRLRLRGLMTIPEADLALARQRFLTLRTLFDELNRDGLNLDTLSMGMSDDFESAIACGSTMVRVGTSIFGARPGKPVAAH